MIVGVWMPKKFQLQRPELSEELAVKLGGAQRARDHQRLTAVRLAMSGELTLAQIGKAVGRARSTVAEWMRVVRANGLPALLALHQGRGRAPQLKAKARKELRTGLRRGRWRRLKDAQQWLARRHRIRMGLGGVRYWVKKAGAVLRVPRKAHARQDPAQVEEFRRTFARRLCALGLPRERQVRVWVADEHRYGLIPTVRRSWGLRRVRTRTRQLLLQRISGPNAPLVTDSIVPLPFIRSPCHTTSALRSVAITPSPPHVCRREPTCGPRGRELP